jgi:hypothetical protein
VTRGIAVAALLMVFVLLGGGQAQAQACGEIEDVPSEFLDDYIETLGGLFPLSAAECEKITKSAVSSCHKAVSASASCAENQVSGVRKGSKTACKAQGDEEDQCNTDVGGLLDLVQGLLDVEADGAHAECDGSFAGVLEDTCQGFN